MIRSGLMAYAGMVPWINRRAVLRGIMGCCGAGTIVGTAAGTEDRPRRGGLLIVAADTEPRNLNPAVVASNGVFYISSKIIEPLAEMDFGQGGLRPVLATSWQPTADGRSITFHLRPGVTWHDGHPFSSKDVAFSAMKVWKVLQNLGQVILRDLEEVETPDPATAIFRFAQPTPAQYILNALPSISAVLPQHIYDTGDISANLANLLLRGTGPFRFSEHRRGQFYRLDRYDGYWDKERPYLDRIIYRILPDAGSVVAALESGEVHLTAFSSLPKSELERLKESKNLVVTSSGYEGLTYLLTVEMNLRRRELANLGVRRAIAHAIDKDLVAERILGGLGRPVTGPIPHTATDFFSGGAEPYPFDTQMAEQLLDEAGYRRPASGAMRFALRLLPAPWFEQTRQMGDYLAQALRTIGIDATIISRDTAGHQRAVYTDHDFDLAIGSPVYRNDPAISTTILYQGGLPAGVPFSNQYGYDDPAMNKLITDAAQEINPAKRVQFYYEFQRKAMADLPLIPVAEFTFVTIARATIRNIGSNPRWPVSSWADTWRTD